MQYVTIHRSLNSYSCVFCTSLLKLQSSIKDPQSPSEYEKKWFLLFFKCTYTPFPRFIESLVKASSFGDLAGVKKLVGSIRQQGLESNCDLCLQVWF
jgi:hypothetical protein